MVNYQFTGLISKEFTTLTPKINRNWLGLFFSWLVLLCMLTLSGCDKLFDQKKSDQEALEEKVKAPEINQANLLNAANLFAYTQLSDALNHAQTLDRVIASFLHHPNPLSLKECQETWVKTYHSYLKASHFYQVPRFEKPQFAEQNQTYRDIHLLLDMWPVEGGYIDYLPGYPLSGIINDMTLKISESSLLEQHGFSEFSYASVGFHPMEFLLFGEDGKRSARDFIPKENSIEVVSIDADDHEGDGDNEADVKASQPKPELSESHSDDGDAMATIQPQNHNRRREYLRILSALLVSNLQKLVDRWEPAHGYYAKAWRHPETEPNLNRLYQVTVDHLQTQVLTQHVTPLATAEVLEDLRSPYSNTDLQNIIAMIEGIQSWWNYENGMQSELTTHQPELASDIEKQFKAIMFRLNKAPKNSLHVPLDKRQKTFQSVQADLLKLLEMLYGSAEVIGVRLKPLPLSHE